MIPNVILMQPNISSDEGSDAESVHSLHSDEENQRIEENRKRVEEWRKRRKMNRTNDSTSEPKEVPLEKAKENDFKVINVIEYLGKLGRIVTSIVNNNYSDKVNKDLLADYVKTEKYLKAQLKRDKQEVIEKKGKRWNAKKFFLTIPYNSSSKEEIMKYYLSNPKMNLCKAAVAQEVHKKAKPELVEKYGTDKHLHVYLEFTAKKDVRNANYFNLPEEFSVNGNINVDIESIKKRTKENIYSYLLKTDKKTYSYGFNIRQDAYGKLKIKEIMYKYAIGEWSLTDIVLYDPSWLLKNLDKIDDRIRENMRLLSLDSTRFIW